MPSGSPSGTTRTPAHAPADRVALAAVLGSIGSVQFGAAIAAGLFEELGAAGTAWVRLAVAAFVLLAVWRPHPGRLGRHGFTVVVAFGLALGGMNLVFYEALARIPLGVAVTLEFLGPLGVAVVGSRRALDVVWVVLAAAGVLLLSGGATEHLDPVGVLCALGAGVLWALYIVLGARVGRAVPGGGGLAIAMTVGAVAVAPAGLVSGGGALLDPGVMAAGAAVALLSSVIPYSLELEALRRLPARVFGVLMSLEPAVAALAGLVVLGQRLATSQTVAIGLVVAASAGATLSGRGSAVGQP